MAGHGPGSRISVATLPRPDFLPSSQLVLPSASCGAMVLSSSLEIFANGWPPLGLRRCTSSLAVHGRTATANRSTRNCATSSSTEKSSTRSRRSKCWQNAGASTTTPSVHTLRWATDRPLHKRGNTRSKQGMEKWKANNASHFPTPPTTAT